jgi:hypothetical protein
MTFFNAASANCPADIREGIRAIEEAAGQYVCSDECPAGVLVTYCQGYQYPWRLADDCFESFHGTVEEAARAAKEWANDLALEDELIANAISFPAGDDLQEALADWAKSEYDEITDKESVTTLIAAAYMGQIRIEIADERPSKVLRGHLATMRVIAGTTRIDLTSLKTETGGVFGCPLVSYDLDEAGQYYLLFRTELVGTKPTRVALVGFLEQDVYELMKLFSQAILTAYGRWTPGGVQ